MAGFIPGLLPTNHSQEKQFAQAYEDVLERYKGNINDGNLTPCLAVWDTLSFFFFWRNDGKMIPHMWS